MASKLPQGTVTFLFTDIEGSTKLLRELGDGFGPLRAEHERLLRAAFAARGGLELDNQGDSFFFAFTRAKDAVLAAVDTQRALATYSWPEGASVRVRVGIHTGEPTVNDGRYVGMAVHRAARIMAAGHGGQILVSEATVRLLDERELEGFRLRDLGSHHLKDLAQPERIFQVDAPGLPREFPPLRKPKPRRLTSGRSRASAALAALVAAGGIVAAALVFGSGDSTGLERLEPNSVGVIDPVTNRLVAQIPVGERPNQLVVGEGAVWVLNAGDHTVSRVDPKRRRIVRTIAVPGTDEPGGLAVGAGAVWLGTGGGGTPRLTPAHVWRISPEFNSVAERLALGESGRPSRIAVADGSLWVTAEAGRIARVDLRTKRVAERLDAGVRTVALAVGQGAVWVGGLNAVARIDPRTGAVSTVTVADGVQAIALGAGAVWAAAAQRDVVSQIDPLTNGVTAIRVGDLPWDVAVGHGSVWVANRADGTISRIDPVSAEVVSTIELGAAPEAIAVGEDAVWVVASASLGPS